MYKFEVVIKEKGKTTMFADSLAELETQINELYGMGIVDLVSLRKLN